MKRSTISRGNNNMVIGGTNWNMIKNIPNAKNSKQNIINDVIDELITTISLRK